MITTAHAIVAGAIAAKFPDPAVSIPLAFTSHFIMDAIPHWDIGTNWRKRSKAVTGFLAIAETLIGITVSYFIYSGKVSFLPLTAVIFVALLPDWLEAPWHIFYANSNKHEPSGNAGFPERLAYEIYRTENFFHAKIQCPFGLITQILVVIFFLVLLQK